MTKMQFRPRHVHIGLLVPLLLLHERSLAHASNFLLQQQAAKQLMNISENRFIVCLLD